MALTLCHTGDWHLGQTLYRRSREAEHARFLAWLVDELEARGADALIVAGDVFDSGSPPGSALAMFYGFLAEARRRLPDLCVVVVAGNHDSPARLAAPDPVLRGLGVSIVGSVPYEGGTLAVGPLVVPVTRQGRVLARVVAMPFLRGADLPPMPEDASVDAHARGARQLYAAAVAHAREARGEGQEPIIVTGHFAAAGARMSRESERLLVGGVDGTLPIDVVDTEGVAYVALGHLHLAQPIQMPSTEAGIEMRSTEVGSELPSTEAGIEMRSTEAKLEVRYAGSPIPLSFAERELEHEVRFVKLERAGVIESTPAVVPRSVRFERVPVEGTLGRAEAVAAIEAYPLRTDASSTDASSTDASMARWPWLEVRAHAGSAERDVLEAIESAAELRAVHLVHVVVERPETSDVAAARQARALGSLDVRDVLVARWVAEHGVAPSADVLDALAEAMAEARVRLDQRRTRSVELQGAPPLVRTPSVAAHHRREQQS